jgi:hypothetical protein
MNEEIIAIRSWVRDALKSAVNARNKKQTVSEYDRGRIAGIIFAYQHVMVETSPTAAGNTPYSSFEEWISKITTHTSLTISDAMEIYHLCDSSDMLSMDYIMDTVIGLWRRGYDSYQIKSALELNAVRNEKWDNTIVQEQRKHDE